MTADTAVAAMTEPEARKLTEKIRITAHNYADARQKLHGYVTEAKAGNAHLALGYASWAAYLSEVLGEEPMRLARGERQEMVQMLSAEGMSTRAIAGTLSVSKNTVTSDLSQVGTPEPITGLDGKTYSRPALTDEPGPITKLTGSRSVADPSPGAEPMRNLSDDVAIINDIRLYLGAIAKSPEIARLTPPGKQHIIDALNKTIDALKEN